MAEKVIIRQKSSFETEFLGPDPHHPEDDQVYPVTAIHHLTPYGMLLASLGSCTAIVLHTYAQSHGLALHEVEMRLTYDRVFKDDCINCAEIDRYEEKVWEEIILTGELDHAERDRLYRVSKQCPIHKMMEDGMVIESKLGEAH